MPAILTISPSSIMRGFALGIVLALSLLATRARAAETCGEKKTAVQQLIRYGYKAGTWPWHGAMFHRVKHSSMYVCGVTILTEQFVITAAHCAIDQTQRQRIPADRVFIMVGVINLDKPDRYTQHHDIDRIIRHEGFNQTSFEDDVALLKLNTLITFNEYVQPICLWQGATKLDNIVSKIGYFVGWGRDESLGLPKDLNEATMPIVSRKECIDSDPNHYLRFYFEPKTFCAGYRNGTHAGPGDSGGGLFFHFGHIWVLRGIVSNTKVTPDNLQIDASGYVVFIDVSYYIDWIKSHVNINIRFEINTNIIENLPSSRPSDGSGSQANLLNIASCGKDRYQSGTPEEMKGYLNQYPWLAVIEYIDTHTGELEDTCHGVLIHRSFLVTAAHCVQRKGLSIINSVRLNDYRLDTVNDIFEINGETIRTKETRLHVLEFATHPNYNTPKFANNIALIKLERSTTVIPICLAPKGSTLPMANKFTIVGWKRNFRKEKPMIRNVVQLADFRNCRAKYALENIFLDTTGGQLCSTYSHYDDSKSCSHYMGSVPFQYVRNGRYFLAAISNFGHTSCLRDDFSDVFTNVGHYADWIQKTVKDNEI